MAPGLLCYSAPTLKLLLTVTGLDHSSNIEHINTSILEHFALQSLSTLTLEHVIVGGVAM